MSSKGSIKTKMGSRTDDSYIVIVHPSQESGIRFYNFDDDIKPEKNKDFINECGKLLNIEPEVIITEHEVKEEPVDVKDEPLDYEEEKIYADLEYLNSDDENFISNDEDINESDLNVINETLPLTKKLVKKKRKKDTAHKSKKNLHNSATKENQYLKKKQTNLTDDLVDGKRKVKGKKDTIKKIKKELNPATEVKQFLEIKLQDVEVEYVDSNSENVIINQEPIEIPELSEMPEETKDLVKLYIRLLEEQSKIISPPIPPEAYKVIRKKYRCRICDHDSENKTLARRHYRYTHGERYNKCLLCDARFRRRDCMIAHENHCKGENAHLVRLAREILIKRKKHEKLTRVKVKKKQSRVKIPCKVCGNLISKPNISTHLARHYPPKKPKRRFFCTECPESFRFKRSLDAHMNVHAGIKPYKCPICGKAFSHKNTQLAHKWAHEENRFQCDYCGRTYRKKSKLVIHIQGDHSGPILCTQCGKTMLKKKWRNHIKYCGKPKGYRGPDAPKYNCVDCEKMFHNIKALNGHMKRMHGKEMFTREKFLELLPKMNISGLEFDLVKTDDIINDRAEDSCKGESLEVLN